MVGTDQSYASLKDQRDAVKTVQVFDEIPQGYEVMGPVDAARCHRNFNHAPPTNELVLVDMQVAAYARGADAIYQVEIGKKGSFKNCWYMLAGKATMLRKVDN